MGNSRSAHPNEKHENLVTKNMPRTNVEETSWREKIASHTLQRWMDCHIVPSRSSSD